MQVVNLDPAAEHFDYPVLAGVYNVMGYLLLKVLSRSLLAWKSLVTLLRMSYLENVNSAQQKVNS